jgi:type II secretory ATPase GspE/PulE/Tfp pilus assembly ATPase PilB-like protein
MNLADLRRGPMAQRLCRRVRSSKPKYPPSPRRHPRAEPRPRTQGSSYFTARHGCSTKTSSGARTRPSVLTTSPDNSNRPVNASAVNYTP